jgi:uncharacterized protein (TIGR00299 family) protein
MKTAYFDLVGGAAGDMLLGALIDAGAAVEPLHALVKSLGIPELELHVHTEMRQFLATTRVEFTAPKEQPHRHLRDVLELVEASGLAAPLAERVGRVFAALADAEARVHGVTPAEVHFHEVGAVDSIADVVCVVFALDALGVTTVECSPLPVCRGVIQGAHGEIPLPGPAVLRIAEAGRAPVEGRSGDSELVTPTAAALLVTLGSRFGDYPAMGVEAVGYGAGSRTAPPGFPPNVTRVVLGAPTVADATPFGLTETVCVVEANLDDQTAEQSGYVAEALFEAGALDVFWTPVSMKKGRPGVMLSVLCDPAEVVALEDLILRETTTLGVRRRRERRVTVPREIVTVRTEYGAVRVKVATRPGGVRTGAPEYDDCAALARSGDVPFQQVYRAAQSAWEQGSTD